MATPLAGPSPLRDELGRLFSPGSTFYAEVMQRARCLARAFGHGEDAVADYAQDLFLRLTKVALQYDQAEGSLSGFLASVLPKASLAKFRTLSRKAKIQFDQVEGTDFAPPGADSPSERTLLDLVGDGIDLQEVLDLLGPEWAFFARELATLRICDLAAAKQAHRSTIHRKVQELRDRVEKARSARPIFPCDTSPFPAEVWGGEATAAPPESCNTNPVDQAAPQGPALSHGVSPMTIDCLPAALDLASRGFRVFPCVAGQKKPLTEHGLKDASTDPTTVQAWWAQWPDANLAINTAGLVVVDVDVDPEDGRPDNAWLKDRPDLMAELDAAPSAVTPRGGRHYFFRNAGTSIANSASKVAPGVDIRGDGGYVLVAPSVTDKGRYEFTKTLAGGPADLPVVPAWLVQMIESAKAIPSPKPTSPAAGGRERVVEGGRNSHLTSLAGSLRRRGFEADEIVRRLRRANIDLCVPPLDDSEVQTIANSMANYPAGPGAPSDACPEVVVMPDEHRVNDEVVTALIGDAGLYQRGGRLVRVVPKGGVGVGVGDDPDVGGLAIQEIEQATLREVITRQVQLVKETKEGPKAVHPPAWLVAAVHERGYWKGVRHLHAVAESPVLRPDGTVVETPGYDAATGVLYRPRGEFPKIAQGANRDDADAAAEALCEVVEDFDFESDVHRSGFLALILTMVGRHAFDGPAPLFLIDANVRGAGKTLLAQAASLIALGRTVPTTSYSQDTDELRKQISMTALEGDPLVVFDNLAGVLGNDALDRALTTTRWRDRRLGGNSKVDAPLITTWAATGNNVSIEADTARRTVHIRLSVADERPEDRSGFKHADLLGYVRANRARLFMAALTILGAYIREHCPALDLRPMGSYEEWSRVIRGALVWCGQPDPCLGRDGMEIMADSAFETGRTLIAAWKIYDPKNQGVVVTDMMRKLYPQGASHPTDDASVGMRAALEQLIGTNRPPTSRAVGNKLRALRDRYFDGWALTCDVKSSRGRVWKLRRLEGGGKPPEAPAPELAFEAGVEEVEDEPVAVPPAEDPSWYQIPGDPQ